MEEWREHPIYTNYQLSSMGNIRTKNRRDEWYIKTCPIKKHHPPRDNGELGYRYTSIGLGSRTQRVVRRIGKMVCEAFHGLSPSPKFTCDHINRITTDDRAVNLRWADSSCQAVNRVLAKGPTNEQNITLTKYNKYRVGFYRNKEKVFDACFDTLEEAVFNRDAFLASL